MNQFKKILNSIRLGQNEKISNEKVLKSKFPTPKNGNEVIVNFLGMELVKILNGTYRTCWLDDYGIPRNLEIILTKDFYIGRTPVTQKQFYDVMNPKIQRDVSEVLPKVNLDWHASTDFIYKLNELERTKGGKYVYSLPTEAEWEYAYRAGSDTKFFWGDDENQIDEYAWWHFNSNHQLNPVGLKEPNVYGLYDMAGNIWEWCENAYTHTNTLEEQSENDYETIINPKTYNSNFKSLRGGSWLEFRHSLFAAFMRGYSEPDISDGCRGFRVVAHI